MKLFPSTPLLAAAFLAFGVAASAATALLDFSFDEGTGTRVSDSVNSLGGNPARPDNPPTFEAASPSGKPGDSAIHFETGQYMTVDDPDTRVQFDRNNPSFTLQAWVKLPATISGRMVFFYSNGPGGAVSFSVNNNRTVFVTTLGIADVSSQAAIPEDDAWHHIAVVHEHDKEFRFYVDGALGDTVAYTRGVNFTRTQRLFSIGAEWNGALQYVGSVDRLKVSSGILTPDQLDSQASPPASLAEFGFDEGSGTTVTDAINSLSGTPGTPANPPTFESSAPSGQPGDAAIHFERGQFMIVNDPDTRIQFSPTNPSFTLQAWVKLPATISGRMVFFYSNGPGGAVSFSVNNNRTVFVTTLGIADVSSQAAIPEDDAWHHIAVVHEHGKEFRFYVDGALGDTVPYDRGVNFTRTQRLFSIGAEWNGALQYVGSVDRLKVSSGILTPAQLDSQASPPASLAEFGFDEGSGTTVTDAINSLSGTPGTPANPPTFESTAPSGQPGDAAIHFERGQYMVVNDPDTRIQFSPTNPSFTLQAWVKLPATISGRMVFFYSNGPGGAVSFSVNNNRTVFVTTLGIADVSSQAAIPEDDAWHHIAVVHEHGKEFRFYVDGALGDTVAYTRGVNFTRTQRLFSIGAEWNGALQYVGSVDRLKITRGILSANQLDSNAIPTAGGAGLVLARPSISPFGVSIGVTDAVGSTLNPASIVLAFDGASVTPSGVSKSGATTTIRYDAPGAPLPSGSSHTVALTVKDGRGVSFNSSSTFTVPVYATLPSNAALPASAVDKSKKGFRIRTYQIDGGTQDGTIAYNEAILAGQHGPNVANLADAGGTDAAGFFTWTGYINFDTTGAANGYFNDPDFVTSPFPGIPGTPSTGGEMENFAQEILAALEFTATGMYTMAVNTDWTGFPNFSDGYLVRAGTNPLDPAASTRIGYFDALAPAGPDRGVANSPFQFYVARPGIYPFRLLYFQTAGSANLEWFHVNADNTRALVNDSNGIPAYHAWTTPPAAPTLSLARTASGISITFTGKLQSTTTIQSGWTDVPGSSPLAVSTTDAARFYRAVQ